MIHSDGIINSTLEEFVMRRFCANFTVFACVVLIALSMTVPAHAQFHFPDETLYTVYSYSQQPATQINWSTCGSTPQTEGCYGSGNFGPFTNVCAIVQSAPAPFNPSTVLRYIYILDTGSTAGGATLTAYKRTDEVTQTDDVIMITQLAVVPLPSIVGGSGVTCYLAQNPTDVYAATNESGQAAVINKTTFSVTQTGIIEGNVSAITADTYGYVTIVQNAGSTSGNSVYGPNGSLESDGGGSYFMINPIDGVNPSNYPPFDGPLPQIGYRLKATK